MANPNVTITLNRFKELNKLFKDNLNAELQAGAQAIEQRAQARAPSGPIYAKVPVKAGKDSEGWFVGAGTKRIFYGLFVELGVRGLSARPFMRPAAEAEFPKIVRALNNLDRNS